MTRSDGGEEPGPGKMVIIRGPPPWVVRLGFAALGERRVEDEASASLEAESMAR